MIWRDLTAAGATNRSGSNDGRLLIAMEVRFHHAQDVQAFFMLPLSARVRACLARGLATDDNIPIMIHKLNNKYIYSSICQ
jgi:hypothetical protein